MTWMYSPVSVEEDVDIVSYLGHINSINADINSLILIPSLAAAEFTYASISAFQHYFGLVNKFFNGLFRYGETS